MFGDDHHPFISGEKKKKKKKKGEERKGGERMRKTWYSAWGSLQARQTISIQRAASSLPIEGLVSFFSAISLYFFFFFSLRDVVWKKKKEKETIKKK